MAQPPNPRSALLLQRIAAWNAAHPPHQDLDPQATHAVAGTEGLSGRIGDGGHAFGDFQLNDAGGVITGKFPGWTPQRKQQWASSPAGIDYALAGISRAAGGQRGEAAVRSIVTNFERPADPQGEIARALAGYGGGQASQPVQGGGNVATALATPRPTVDPRQLLSLYGGDSGAFYAKLGQVLAGKRADARGPATASPVGAVAPPVQHGAGGLAELIHEGVGGPTHSTGEHIHAAFTDPQAMLAAIGKAQQLGLSVRENPYTGDTVDPVHAPNSFHNRNFPGKYNGRTLGEASDVSGSAPAMAAYERWVRQTYGAKR